MEEYSCGRKQLDSSFAGSRTSRMQDAGVKVCWRLVYREPEARKCDTDLDFLKVGPERKLHAAVNMQLKLQWKTQDISHVRYMGHSQPSPQKKPEWNHFQRKVRSIKATELQG